MTVKRGTLTSFFRRTFLKFDLTATSLSTITSAKVRLYASSVTPFSVTAYQTTDNWTETGITCANAPATGTAIQAVSITAAGAYYEWDVTSYVQSQISGDKIVSLVFNDAVAANQTINFNSKESAAYIPELVIVSNQTITFPALLAKNFGNAAFNPGATASSGLTVTYASSNSAVATIVGGNINIVGAGTSTITASQAGNANYNAATSVPQTLTVNKINQTITFPALLAKNFGNTAFNPGATASSGLTVTYTSSNSEVATIVGGNINIVGAGTSTITASQAGNANYNTATRVPQTLTVNKANQTITFAALPAKVVGNTDFSPGAVASSGLPALYTSSNPAVATIVSGNIRIVGAGTSDITVSQAGNANYNAAANVLQTLTVTVPTYYIDSVNGVDTNNGLSSATAWQNITKLNNLTIAAGTQILLKAGSEWTGQQLKFLGSGTSTEPIIVDKYGTGAKPLLKGNGLVGEAVLYLYNQSYIEVNNLEITNLPVGATFFNVNGADRRGVMIVIDDYGTANHIYLKNLDIHHIKGQLGSTQELVNGAIPKKTGGIFLTVLGATETITSNSRFNDVLIDSCNIYYCENTGISIDNEWNTYYPGGQNSSIAADVTEYNNWYARRNTNLRISNNVIHHIGKNAMIIRMTDETGLIEHNVCYETAMGTTGNTMFTARCKGTVFQYNEGYYNRASTQKILPGNYDGCMYDADYGSVDVIFQYSYSHDNSEGLFWGCNTRSSTHKNRGIPDPGDKGCTLRYCISQNDLGSLVYMNYPSAGFEIYNNVFYIKAGLSPIILREDPLNKHTYNYYNNIIYNLGRGTYSFGTTQQTRTISHNTFYGNLASTEPADANKIRSNPLLVNPGTGAFGINTLGGYKLQNGSPCVNTGTVITNNGGLDYWGNILYNGLPDRGANEFIGQQRIGRTTKGITQNSQSENEKQDFVLFPNPYTSGDLFLIFVGFNMDEQISIDVLSTEGKQLLWQKGLPADLGKISFPLPLSKGVYLINIKSDQSNITKKLVVH
jgi:uncharacterized protein YaiE (UPF0345 family)